MLTMGAYGMLLTGYIIVLSTFYGEFTVADPIDPSVLQELYTGNPQSEVCADSALRLQGGSSPTEGRVEVCIDGMWGTVCDDEWDSIDAGVVCKQLGFSEEGAVAASSTLYGQGIGPIHLDDVSCSAGTSKLVDCSHRGRGVHNCAHHEDAGVICQNHGTPKDGVTVSAGGPISYQLRGAYEFIWNDKGSGADEDVSFWRPQTNTGFYALGDASVASHSEPAFSAATVRANVDGALAPPDSFQEVWDDSGSGADEDVRVMRMIPPSGYTCLGYVAIKGHNSLPDANLYRCVKSEYAELDGSYQLIWNDKGSGADEDVAVWVNSNDDSAATINANTFTAFATHNQPNGQPFLLKSSAVEEVALAITCTLSAETYKPIFLFDRAAGDYCYPDWPSQVNDGNCRGDLDPNAPILFEEDDCGEYRVFTYWLWYGWQKPCIFNQGSHGNDWEHISVFVSLSSCEVHSVVYSQHGGHYTRRTGTFNSVEDRPLVYIGKIAHGSYHDYCDGVCSFYELITGLCLGSINYCQGGCGYWDDFRNPGPSLTDGVLYPLKPGEVIDGIERRDESVCDIGTCEGDSIRRLTESGCWQDAP